MPRDYNEESSSGDYKRKRHSGGAEQEAAGEQPQVLTGDIMTLNEKTNAYLDECLSEKKQVEKKNPICKRLLDDEVEKILVSGRIPKPEIYANIYSEKPIRVAQKVLFPIKEYPKFNFVGKILGPKGNTLRHLQEETFCKMVVMGRNSMRDHQKEEELRASGNPKYAHLSRDLHVEISTVAPPSEAYHRISYALTEIRKFMIPDGNDDIRMEQLREMDGKDRMFHHYSKSYGGGGGEQSGGANSRTSPYDKSTKPKVYSILEKARYVMDDPNYRFMKTHRSRDAEFYDHTNDYGRYATPPQTSKHSSSHHMSYEGGGGGGGRDYERDYRRDYHSHSSSYSGYAEKPNSDRSSYRPVASGPHSSTHYESGGSRSRDNIRYRSAPYARKVR